MAGDAKIQSKDLSYDTTLPPFLQRLQAQHTGRGDPDRHERPIARPRRAKDPNDDDEPTMIDESGETVSKEHFAQLSKGDQDASAVPTEDGSRPNVAGASAKLTDGAAAKKRKVAKVVGEGDDAPDVAEADLGDSGKKNVKKPKKKAKPIKLAFDDD